MTDFRHFNESVHIFIQAMEECLPKEIVIEYKEAFKILDRKKVGKISIRVSYTLVLEMPIGLQLTHDLATM